MILAAMLLSIPQPARLDQPARPPAWSVRYVSTWRTRYAIDAVEVDLEDVERRIGTLELEEIKVGVAGWQIRWLIFRTKGER